MHQTAFVIHSSLEEVLDAYLKQDLAYAICRPTGVTLSDGSVLITGGLFTIGGPAQGYDPILRLFSTTGDMSAGRTHHTATLLADGDVLVAGGCTADCLTDTAA